MIQHEFEELLEQFSQDELNEKRHGERTVH